MTDAMLTLASLAACFWLGFQIGHIRSELQRKADIEALERRFKIITGNFVETHYKVVNDKAAETSGLRASRTHPGRYAHAWRHS